MQSSNKIRAKQKSSRKYYNRTALNNSEASSKFWKLISGLSIEGGYQALFARERRKTTQYRVLSFNNNGVLTDRSLQKDKNALIEAGFQSLFKARGKGNAIQPGDTNNGNSKQNLPGRDDDRNGLVDGRRRSHHRLFNDGNFILITDKRGKTFSNISLGKWNAIAAGKSNGKHLVLLSKKGQEKDHYKVWTLSRAGVIRSRSRVMKGFTLTKLGYEEIFPIDFNNDGATGNSVYAQVVDRDSNKFSIEGTPEVGQTLRIIHTRSETGGSGTPPVISWTTSLDGVLWNAAGSGETFTIPNTLEGHQLSASITYRDSRGLTKSVRTEAEFIPFVDNGDAAYIIDGSPTVGATLTIFQVMDDPDGNGSVNITWSTSADGVNWSQAHSGRDFTISPQLEGKRLKVDIAYADAQGFEEFLKSDQQFIPFVNDGDAAYAIDGIPDVGQQLTITQIADDPDGNGNVDITWQSSADGSTWMRYSSSESLVIESDLAGRQLNAVLQYTDAQGFKESVTTDSVTVSGQAINNPSNGDDYGESPATSGQLSTDGSTTGVLERMGDLDWFAISLQAGKRYQFDLSGISLTDPFLYLHDSGSELINYNDDANFGTVDSQITFTAAASGTYYLGVGSYYNAYTGDYILRASELAPPNPDFSRVDGFGHVDARKAFEQLLNVQLSSVDPLGGNLWTVDNVNAPEIWAGGDGFSGSTGEGITIAVIDSGVDLDHPEFSGRIVPGYDFVDGDGYADDGNGHGTHVAGTIAAANDGIGVTGIAHDARIMPLRVLNRDGYGWTRDIISAVRWAADNNADVINMSLGAGGYSQAMADAIQYASELGSVVVMAAGNSGIGQPDYPAAFAINHGIAVGAADRSRSLAGFSNRAGETELDYITAPGVGIYSAVPGGGYATFNGSSMAAPHVAGVAGLLKSHDPSLSASAVEDLLTGSASNASGSGFPGSAGSTGALQSPDLITQQTLKNFTQKQLKGTLIASLGGSADERLSTIRNFERTVDGIRHFDVVDSSRNAVAVLELSRSKAVDRIALLNDLLNSDQFNYFEIEQKFSIV